jgi:hypothetical protein
MNPVASRLASLILSALITTLPLLCVKAETLELPPGFSPWTWTTEVWTDAGYQDNLLLSRDARESSPFARVGAEVGVMRIPVGPWRLQAGASAEEKRFTGGQTVDHERFGNLNIETSLGLGGAWSANLGLQYLYEDQVTDASITETNLASLPVQAHTFDCKPSLRYDLPGGWWLDVGGQVTRQRYLQAELDDYWEVGPRVTLGHHYGNRSEFTLEAGLIRRAYDERVRFTEDGQSIPGQPLRLRIASVNLQVRHFWDEARRWRTVTKLGIERSEDDGSGYFSYQRSSVSQQVRYRTRAWELRVQGRLAHYEYDRQRDDTGVWPRRKDLVRVNVHAERRLTRWLQVHADYEFEDSISNQGIDGYTANTVSMGMGWEF